ncbi:unnamed protein product [Heterobilharzia americana]|nr:unnamed protein product [Heterobilharzia americana]
MTIIITKHVHNKTLHCHQIQRHLLNGWFQIQDKRLLYVVCQQQSLLSFQLNKLQGGFPRSPIYFSSSIHILEEMYCILICASVFGLQKLLIIHAVKATYDF